MGRAMAQITEPPVIPNLSLPVPQRTDPESFSLLMDRTLLEIPLTVDGINLTVRWTYDTAQLVKGFSQAAAQSAADAAQQVELAKDEVSVAQQEVVKAQEFAQNSATSAAASEQARVDITQVIDAMTGELGLPEGGTVGATIIKTVEGVAFDQYPLGDQARANEIPLIEVNADYLAQPFQVIGLDTRSGEFEVTLPANPRVGMWVSFFDSHASWDKNNPTIARNGSRIMGKLEDMTVDIKGRNFTLTYVDETNGWMITK